VATLNTELSICKVSFVVLIAYTVYHEAFYKPLFVVYIVHQEFYQGNRYWVHVSLDVFCAVCSACWLTITQLI